MSSLPSSSAHLERVRDLGPWPGSGRDRLHRRHPVSGPVRKVHGHSSAHHLPVSLLLIAFAVISMAIGIMTLYWSALQNPGVLWFKTLLGNQLDFKELHNTCLSMRLWRLSAVLIYVKTFHDSGMSSDDLLSFIASDLSSVNFILQQASNPYCLILHNLLASFGVYFSFFLVLFLKANLIHLTVPNKGTLWWFFLCWQN